MHAGRNHQGRMQAARMTMRMPHMIKNHCIVYRLVWLLQGNGAVKREQRELVPNFLRLFGSKRHPSGCRAAKREHHRHFSGNGAVKREQRELVHICQA